jgi:hypothetical protein
MFCHGAIVVGRAGDNLKHPLGLKNYA